MRPGRPYAEEAGINRRPLAAARAGAPGHLDVGATRGAVETGAASPVGRHRRVVRICQTAAFTVLAAFVLHAALGVGGHKLDGFFNDWIYDGLIVASAAGCLARALL